VIRQMTAVVCHDPVQFIPSTEHVRAVIAVGVKMPMPESIRPDYPDESFAADEYHVVVDNPGDIDVVWHRLIDLLDNDGRRRRGRGRQCARQDFVDFVRIDHELALLIGRAPGNDRSASDRRKGNPESCSQMNPRLNGFYNGLFYNGRVACILDNGGRDSGSENITGCYGETFSDAY
jgi:hypothetical protein